jgi:mannose-6-phosphate isomerase-like protein (cupin superfamily)
VRKTAGEKVEQEKLTGEDTAAIEAEPKPSVFDLRIQLLKQGRTGRRKAETSRLRVGVKSYAMGGENALHTHRNQDHAFIILQGKATFYGTDGKIGTLGRHQGIMIPLGAFYSFESCGEEPLILLRVGGMDRAAVAYYGAGKSPARFGPDGKRLPSDSVENKKVPEIPIEGAYFE